MTQRGQFRMAFDSRVAANIPPAPNRLQRARAEQY
jgi:hypothetical protein